jgi:hypothetical protein
MIYEASKTLSVTVSIDAIRRLSEEPKRLTCRKRASAESISSVLEKSELTISKSAPFTACFQLTI